MEGSLCCSFRQLLPKNLTITHLIGIQIEIQSIFKESVSLTNIQYNFQHSVILTGSLLYIAFTLDYLLG